MVKRRGTNGKLINDAEAAIAEAHPPEQGRRTDLELVSAGLTSSQKVATSEMRTAAVVWADKRDAVEADPEAEVPTRA